MKIIKILLISFALLMSILSIATAQDKSKAAQEEKVVWYGIDFSIARFTLVTENPSVIVNQYIPAINQLILTEPEKYDLKKFFNKKEIINAIKVTNERNSTIDPTSLVIDNEFNVEPDQVAQLIKGLQLEEKDGMGLIFVAENLNKTKQVGSYYVCFFDIASRNIIDSRRMEGKAVGIGFRNYWAGSIYNIMKVWMK
jgi:hypothetical protein